DLTEESRLGLFNRHPENSAFRTLTVQQRNWGIILGVLTAVGLVFWNFITLLVVSVVAQFYYLGLTFYKLRLVDHRHMTEQGLKITPADLAQIDRAALPIYTVLVPAYREASVLPILAKALSELDYPHHRLDVKLLLEADDRETIAAARALQLPSF